MPRFLVNKDISLTRGMKCNVHRCYYSGGWGEANCGGNLASAGGLELFITWHASIYDGVQPEVLVISYHCPAWILPGAVAEMERGEVV